MIIIGLEAQVIGMMEVIGLQRVEVLQWAAVLL